MAQDHDLQLYFGFISRSVVYVKGKNVRWTSPGQSIKGSGLIVTPHKISYVQHNTAGVYEFPGERNYLLISDTSGIKVYKNDSLIWQMDDPELTDLTVTDICLTANRHLLVSSTHGFEIINMASLRRIRLLQGIRISGCAADIAGNFWITTVNNGVYMLHRELDAIHPLKEFDGNEWVQVNSGKIVATRSKELFELAPVKGKVLPVKISDNIPNFYNPLLLTDKFTAFYDTWTRRSLVKQRNGNKLISISIFWKNMYEYGGRFFFAYGKTEAYYYQQFGNEMKKVGSTYSYAEKITASCQDQLTGDVFFATGGSIYKANLKTAQNDFVFSSPEPC